VKVILFGATGMVGQGALRECILDARVERVLCIVRSATGQKNMKLTELVHKDFFDYSAIESQFLGYDACFYCAGPSSAGMSEEAYSHMTYDMTMAAAETLARLNPAMTFIYVSGAGTDSTEKGRTMWARVKGKTENALLRLPLRAAYMFRPGIIQPLHGIQSKTASYRVLYDVAKPLFAILRWLAPRHITSTEQLGRAMILVAQNGFPKPILEAVDITRV
jgi:nucleoside-diphosphate-sugar epimerase